MTKKVIVNYVKEVIHELYNSLAERPEKSSALLDILDVLAQVYKRSDQGKNIPNISSIALSKYIYGRF